MTEGLLPCWRCGVQDAQMYYAKGKYHIICSHCKTASPFFKSSLAAAKFWNDDYLNHRKENNNETQ